MKGASPMETTRTTVVDHMPRRTSVFSSAFGRIQRL
jgi:hypothetical protein